MAAPRGSAAVACLLGLALAAFVAPTFVSGFAPRRAAAQLHTQRHAYVPPVSGDNEQRKHGPIVIYAKALMDGAAESKESVPVTKDILRVRDMFNDDGFLEELLFVQNSYGIVQLKKAEQILGLMGKMESSVLPKFVRFLAKKNRLESLRPILDEYVSALYSDQGIVPVLVSSAQTLTDDQMQKIKEKMKAKTGAKDIKLVNKIEPFLLAGFRLEWGFGEPEKMESPAAELDLSLRKALAVAALDKGVLMGA